MSGPEALTEETRDATSEAIFSSAARLASASLDRSVATPVTSDEAFAAVADTASSFAWVTSA